MERKLQSFGSKDEGKDGLIYSLFCERLIRYIFLYTEIVNFSFLFCVFSFLFVCVFVCLYMCFFIF